MAGGCVEHQFMAPIEGEAYRFLMECRDGVPVAIYAHDIGDSRVPRMEIGQDLAQLNILIAKGLPWGAVCTQHQGDLGAIIEAVEARRAEIYGAAPQVPS